MSRIRLIDEALLNPGGVSVRETLLNDGPTEYCEAGHGATMELVPATAPALVPPKLVKGEAMFPTK